MIPLEVALLLKVKPIGAGTSVAVTLLDWFDLDDELILILERPVPCLDLIDYMNSRGPTLQEQEAKVSCWWHVYVFLYVSHPPCHTVYMSLSLSLRPLQNSWWMV